MQIHILNKVYKIYSHKIVTETDELVQERKPVLVYSLHWSTFIRNNRTMHRLIRSESFERYTAGLYWKITWPPLIYTSALKIVPLVARVYSAGFIKCLDIAVSCPFWISAVNCESKKITTIFTVLNLFFKAFTFASDKSLRALIVDRTAISLWIIVFNK